MMILHLGVVVGVFSNIFQNFHNIVVGPFSQFSFYFQSYSMLFTHVINFNNPIEAQIVGPQHLAQHALV
jgi:hypothetical protein